MTHNCRVRISLMALVVAVVLAEAACDGLECGEGTVEKDGVCMSDQGDAIPGIYFTLERYAEKSATGENGQ